jgi:hypothetical protein
MKTEPTVIQTMLSDIEKILLKAIAALEDPVTLVRPCYEEGASIMTMLSSTHDRIDEPFVHMILQHFTMEEARELRLVCREFRDNIDVTPFDDLMSPIGAHPYGADRRHIRHCIELWRMSFPTAIAARVDSGYNFSLLQDDDFVFFRGLRKLVISQCNGFTDAAFVHLRGLHMLDMSYCSGISDAAFVHLQGIRQLIMHQYIPSSITDAALVHLRGIETLRLGAGHHLITPVGCEQLYGITDLCVPRFMHPLIVPAMAGNADAAMRVIEEGDPMWLHAADYLKSSPLHWASKRGLKAVVLCLLQRGADPTVTNMEEDTPLHWALQRGHVAIAQLLLTWGADLNVKNTSYKTPLSYAIIEYKRIPTPDLKAFIEMVQKTSDRW